MRVSKPKPKVRQTFPKGWDQERVQAVIDHYDQLTDADWAALIESGKLSKVPAASKRRTTRK